MATKHIDKGWQSYRAFMVPADAPPERVEELRTAYFAGAAILNQTVLLALTPGPESTRQDERFMLELKRELDEFGQQLDARVLGGTRQ